MSNIVALYISIVFLGFLIFIAFVKWIIRSSVRNALDDVFSNQTFYDNLIKSITYSILNANARIEYDKKITENNERPTE